MANQLLKQLTDILLKLPFHAIDHTALHKFWISGFANCDDLVRDLYTTFQELDDFKYLPKLIQKASCIVEELIQYYDISNNSRVGDEGPHVDGRVHQVSELTSDDTHLTKDGANSVLPQGRNSGPWTYLLQSGIKHQSVISFLFIFLQAECSSDINRYDKELSLVSARLYFDLLCLPGCKAFGIFQGTIFQNAVSCLGIKGDAAGKNSKTQSTRGKGGGRGKNRKRPTTPTSDSGEGSDTNSPVNSASSTIIPLHVQLELIFQITVSLENVLVHVPLKEHEQLFGSTIEKLVEFTAWEPELVPDIGNLANSRHRPTLQNRSISGQAYKNLLSLLVPIHGDIHTTFCQVFFRLIPCLIMSGAGNAQTISRHHILMKENAVQYVCYLVTHFSPEVLPSARILLQLVSTRLADRAEFRAKVSQAVVSISNSFPSQEREKMIEWFLKLCQSAKASHRVFALEVMFSLLIHQHSDISNETILLASRLSLLKIIVEHCDDKSPTVSAKAMSILSSNHLPINEVLNAESGIDMHALSQLLFNSCNDEKSSIRKAAIQVLERIICTNEAYLTELNLGTIALHAQDVNVSVQKQSSVSVNNILQKYPDSALAQNLWLEAQLPLVYADEISVHEKGMEALESIFLKQVLTNKELGWTLLEKVSDGQYEDKQQHLRKAFSIWLREKKITPKTALSIVHLRMDGIYDSVAWMLLTFLTLGHKIPDLEFAVEACSKEMLKPTPNIVLLRRMLQVVIQTAQYLPVKGLTVLLKELELNIKCFKFPTPVISVVFLTIEKLFVVLFEEEAEKKKSEWCLAMVQDMDTLFNNTINFENGVATFNPDLEEILVCCIFTLGEVFQFCPWHLPGRMKDFIHSLVGSPVTSQDTLDPSCFPLSTPPAPGTLTVKIKAHAIITFGKICIGDKEFCKSSLLTAVKELRESPEPCIRNNVALAMTDLLVFHANLIEPYIPDITACLRDRSEFVRRQTLAALAKLLKEDYIKWKRTLFYRILLCCVDESKEVANMAEYCLTQLLLKRHPNAFAHHYVECIFYLNSYTQHESYNQFLIEAKDDLQLFSLKDFPLKREKLYRFLLRSMPDQDRFRLHERLCQDILGPIIDGILPLNADSNGLVKDALMILSCEEIKLTPLAGVHEEEDGTEMEAIRADARKSITALIRNEVIRGILPIIISLKRELEQKLSPLMREVELFLKEFLKDFKNEIKDIIGEDRQLANEIAYIIRQPSEARGDNGATRASPQSVRNVICAPNLDNSAIVTNGEVITGNRRNSSSHQNVNNSPKDNNGGNNSEKGDTESSPTGNKGDNSVRTENPKRRSSLSSTIVDSTGDATRTSRILTSTPHMHSGKSLFHTTMEISNVMSSSNSDSQSKS